MRAMRREQVHELPNGTLVRGDTHGTQVFQGCRKLLGRDHYASRNIWDCVLNEIRGRGRPAHLCTGRPGPL
jgi:hypothetical protein